MAFSPWQHFITDATGAIDPTAIVTVRLESSGALATIYSDAAGSAKGNPFTVAINGLARFYSAGGDYKVVVNEGEADEESFRNVKIGEAAGFDVGADSGSKLLTRDQLDARYTPAAQNNTTAVTDPTVTDDSSAGYAADSRWFNQSTDESWLCLDASVGAALWVQTSLTLDELGSIVLKNFGTLDAEIQDNAAARAEFLAKALTVVEIAGTSYTLTATDNGKMLVTTNASPVTITCPEDATEALGAGFQCIVERGGDGLVTIAVEGTDVLRAAEDVYTIDVKYGAASIVKQSSGVWWATGALQYVIDQTGLSLYDLLQWDGAAFVRGVDTLRGGVIDYADLATATTPLAYTGGSGYVNLPNDGAGSVSYNNAPQGVTDIYDTVNDRFDWSDLKLGDMLDSRFDVSVTTGSANQEVLVAINFAVGGTPYRIPLARQQFKVAGTYPMTGNIPFDLGDANTLNNYANFQISSDGNMNVRVNGWRTQIYIKG